MSDPAPSFTALRPRHKRSLAAAIVSMGMVNLAMRG